MQKGKVKWFNEKKGYGFIESEGKEYFVHFKEIQGSGFKTLNEGDHVTFTPKDSSKGALALNVSNFVFES